jgi:predicted DNA-binding ArsR family transcriptional regulator
MWIAIEVDERMFLRPKTREDIEREVLEAVSTYWMARRDIEQAQSRSVVRPSRRNLVEVLLSAPAIGDDADFERSQDLGRPGIEWDT